MPYPEKKPVHLPSLQGNKPDKNDVSETGLSVTALRASIQPQLHKLCPYLWHAYNIPNKPETPDHF